MRYLAFDVGTKKIGVAKGEDESGMSFPVSILLNNETLFNKIFSLCEIERPDAFVVGLPDSGVEVTNDNKKVVTLFIKQLESQFDIPVYTVNEYGTSHAVKLMQSSMIGQKFNQSTKRRVQENKLVDASAAALILQRYIDSQKTKI